MLNAVNASGSCAPFAFVLYHRDGLNFSGSGKYRGLYSVWRPHLAREDARPTEGRTDADHVNRDLRPLRHNDHSVTLYVRRIGDTKHGVFYRLANHDGAGREQTKGFVKHRPDLVQFIIIIKRLCEMLMVRMDNLAR